MQKGIDKLPRHSYNRGSEIMERLKGDNMTAHTVNDAALGDFIDLGFSLSEPDDHFTELYFKDKKIATYFQTTVTIPVIREDCQNFLNNINQGL